MSKGFASNYRIVVLAVAVLLAFAGLGARLVCLHVVDRPRLLGFIEKARYEVVEKTAVRGNILDSRGKLLATGLSLWTVNADPSDLRASDEKKWPDLARLTGQPLAEVEKLLTTKYRQAASAPVASGNGAGLVFNSRIHWVKLSEGMPEETREAIAKLDLQGIYCTPMYRRAYPHRQLAAHLIGFVEREKQVPVTGLERYLDFYLRGVNGWVETEKDGHRRELAQFRTREVPPANGFDVVLSIDSQVQAIVEEELADIARKYQPHKATIIVGDPKTGFILALGNYPTFDPNAYNELSKDEQGRMNNVAVDAEYEPGSVFKIVAAAGALNEGLVTPETMFDCALKTVVYEGKVRKLPKEDISDHFTNLSVSDIIAKSSNKGAAQLAMLLGDKRFYAYARSFGFGQLTGFPVGGEIRGVLLPPERWDGLTITRMPMGQGGVAATVLQMHQAMGVIASGGELLRPQIIREIRGSSGATVFRYGTSTARRVVSRETARTMSKLLLGVTEKYATEAAIDGYEVAGKTGTAQKPNPAGGGYLDHHHVISSFVGFFPANAPQISITVVVDDAQNVPGGTAYGRMVAGPAFRNIALKLIPYLDIRPAQPDLSHTLALEGGLR